MAAGSRHGPIGRALETALEAVETKPADAATVALARRCAADVDSGEGSLDRVGSVLLRAMVELGMTPKARSGVVRGGDSDDGSDRKRSLDELRERRERRRPNDAAAVD